MTPKQLAERLRSLEGQLVVIRGSVGTGKTTLIRQCVAVWAKNHQHNPGLPVPLYLPLDELRLTSWGEEADQPLTTLLHQYLKRHSLHSGRSEHPDLTWQALQERRLIVIFDGLERIDATQRQGLLEFVTRVKTLSPITFILVTSTGTPLRVNDYDVLRPDQEYEVPGLTRLEDFRGFIAQASGAIITNEESNQPYSYASLIHPQPVEETLARVLSSPLLEELCRSPGFLHQFTYHVLRRDTEPSVADLLQKVLKRRIGQARNRGDVIVQVGERQQRAVFVLRELLGRLADHTHPETLEFRAEVLFKFEKQWAVTNSGDTNFDDRLVRAGLLQEGYDDDYYRFSNGYQYASSLAESWKDRAQKGTPQTFLEVTRQTYQTPYQYLFYALCLYWETSTGDLLAQAKGQFIHETLESHSLSTADLVALSQLTCASFQSQDLRALVAEYLLRHGRLEELGQESRLPTGMVYELIRQAQQPEQLEKIYNLWRHRYGVQARLIDHAQFPDELLHQMAEDITLPADAVSALVKRQPLSGSILDTLLRNEQLVQDGDYEALLERPDLTDAQRDVMWNSPLPSTKIKDRLACMKEDIAAKPSHSPSGRMEP